MYINFIILLHILSICVFHDSLLSIIIPKNVWFRTSSICSLSILSFIVEFSFPELFLLKSKSFDLLHTIELR